jgi:DNA-binding transcriptional LysR family regulator
VRPTAGGYALAAKMGTLLASYNSAMLEVRSLVRGQPNQLRIGYLASVYEEYLAPALKRLRQVYPRTKVKLLDLFPGEQITALRCGQIDVAITQEIGDLLGRDFYMRELAVTESIVCLPAGHPLASRKQVNITELKNETFVCGTEERVPGYRRRLAQICRNYGKFRPKLIDNNEDLSSKLAMVANEDAVALLPGYMRHQTAPGVVIVPVADARATWKLFVVWQPGTTAGPLRTLLDLLPAKTTIAAHARNDDERATRLVWQSSGGTEGARRGRTNIPRHGQDGRRSQDSSRLPPGSRRVGVRKCVRSEGSGCAASGGGSCIASPPATSKARRRSSEKR